MTCALVPLIEGKRQWWAVGIGHEKYWAQWEYDVGMRVARDGISA